MANQWFRMYGEFLHDQKVQMMSEAYQRRLIMLFCARCNGDETLHDEEVSFLLRISSEEWAITKAVFIEKNFIDADNNLINWDKRQFKSDSSSQRVRAYREKLKQPCNVSETAPDTDTDTDTDTDIKKDIPSGISKKPPEENLKEKKPRGTRLPGDWICDVKMGEWAMGQGLTREEVVSAIDQFRDHYTAATGKGSTALDWDAKFRTWIRNEKRWKK